MPEEPQPLPPPVAEPAPPGDPLAEEVARRVAALRRERGLSERVAAKLLRTSQTQLRRMEDPRYLPSLRSLSRLAAAYGYRLKVEFQKPVPEGAEPEAERAPQRARAASASASPSKAQRAAPGRGRASGRGRSRGAARRPRK